MAVTNETGLRRHHRARAHPPGTKKRELLEIAKANEAKTFGTDNIILPASLKISTVTKESVKVESQTKTV